MKTRTINLSLAVISFAVFASLFSVAMAQSSGAVAGSSSQSGATAGSQAGAIGIQINPAPTAGFAPAQLPSNGLTPTGTSSVLSPNGTGVGVGGSSSAGANASPTIVVGSGNTYEASDLGDAVPALFIPNLTTSNGTCMGSFSSGITVSGFGGGLGKTYTSKECNARFNANQMNALGAPLLAVEIMCQMDAVYEADLRMALAGNKQRCTPRDDVEADPVVTWFPDNDNPEVAMFEGSIEPIIWGGDYPDMQTNR